MNHGILVDKLEHIGVRGIANSWFRSFMHNRRQYVHINDVDSSTFEIKYGIPQGSVLGPLLFIIYINDFSNVLTKLKSVHYADDTTLYFSGGSVEEVVDVVNGELKEVDSWLICNRLSINFKKTHYMIISNRNVYNMDLNLRNKRLKKCSVVKLLGIWIDDRLNFREHVNKTVSKLSRSIGVLRRVSNVLPPDIMIRLYYSMMYPYIIYAVTAWGNSSIGNSNKIERMQRRFCKVIGLEDSATGEMLNVIGLLAFRQIYVYFISIKFYKCIILEQHQYFSELINEFIPNHRHETRFIVNQNFNLPNINLSRCRKSFIYDSIVIWNSLPLNVRLSPHINSFKRKLKEYLLENINA